MAQKLYGISMSAHKRKAVKAVIPLRSMESLFLLCRDLDSTFEI